MNQPNTKPRVRLLPKEMEIIRATVVRLLSDRTCIRIYGSRAREDEKGGDLDILVETECPLPNRVASACRLASELQMQLGDQKIDVILIDPLTNKQPIHQIARQTGVMI